MFRLPKIPARRSLFASFWGRIAAGALTIAPLAITLWALWFLVNIVAAAGKFVLQPFLIWLDAVAPWVQDIQLAGWQEMTIQVAAAIAVLFVAGLLAGSYWGEVLTRVTSAVFDRVPIARTVYGGVEKLIESFRGGEDRNQKVVLIEFPSPTMKAMGFVTKRFVAADTGQELAAVYVPTTPNPTSGYVEIVPVERLVWLDWTPDQAIQFIVSGGVIAPDDIRFQAAPPEPRP